MNVKDRRGRWFAAPAALAVLVVALLASASAGAQRIDDAASVYSIDGKE